MTRNEWTKFLAFENQKIFKWNVSWMFWKTVYLEFNVKIHYEINNKLVFHELHWKKNFTV